MAPEPVNKWQEVGPDHFNISDAFFAEPERYLMFSNTSGKAEIPEAFRNI